MAVEWLLDTSVWIDLLRAKHEDFQRAWRDKIEAGEAALCGPVLGELIQGYLRQEDRDRMTEHFRGLPYFDAIQEDWLMAGFFAAETRKSGQTVSLTDCLIAAMAKRRKLVLVTRDKDFVRLKGIKMELV